MNLLKLLLVCIPASFAITACGGSSSDSSASVEEVVEELETIVEETEVSISTEATTSHTWGTDVDENTDAILVLQRDSEAHPGITYEFDEGTDYFYMIADVYIPSGGASDTGPTVTIYTEDGSSLDLLTFSNWCGFGLTTVVSDWSGGWEGFCNPNLSEEEWFSFTMEYDISGIFVITVGDDHYSLICILTGVKSQACRSIHLMGLYTIHII